MPSRSTARPAVWAVLLFAFSLAASQPFPAYAEGTFDGRWAGEIQIPGSPLAFDIDLATADDGSLSGDISIPVQGARDLPLADVSAEISAEGSTVRFRIQDVPGDPSFEGQLSEDGTEVTGSFTQGGGTIPFAMSRSQPNSETSKEALATFADLAEGSVEAWQVPGVAIAIVKDGEVIFAEGYGHRDLEGDLPMTADTLAAIGSSSKAFTATLLGILADEGELDWEEPLRTYLPSFRLADSVAGQRLTPRDLVTHRSGLPRHDLIWYNNNEITRGELVERLAHVEATADLRTRFQYNNLMFITAGYLAEQLTGKTWEEGVRDRILSPLGMERTNFQVAASQADADHALPYRLSEDDPFELIPFRTIDVAGPAGSINSSVREMAAWVRMNLEHGRTAAGETVVEAATLAEIHTPQMVTGAPSIQPQISAAAYAHGWFVDTYRGHRRLQHGGNIDGFSASVMLFPDDALGVVALTNTGSGLPGVLGQHAADLFLDLEPIDWSGQALVRVREAREMSESASDKEEEAKKPGTRPSHPLADYAGDYGHSGYGLLAITLEGEALRATYNGIEAPLEHWHYDVWHGADTDGDKTFEGMKFLFRSNLEGEISAVEAPFEPTASPIVFTKQPERRFSDPEFLQGLTGRYQLGPQVVTVALAGDRLTASIPGQPTFGLEPIVGGRFRLVEVPAITLGFKVDATGTGVELTLYQPGGVFEALRLE